MRQLLAAAHVPRMRGRAVDRAAAFVRAFGGCERHLPAVAFGGRWDGEEPRNFALEDGHQLFRGYSRS